MRKVSDTFLLVAMILSYVSSGIYFVAGAILFIIYGTITIDPVDAEILKPVFLVWGIVLFVLGTLCVLYSVLLDCARKSKTDTLFIWVIVASAIMSEVGMVGAIIGLIANKRGIE